MGQAPHFFHDKRHPADLAEKHINQFLSHLAVKDRVAASTQNQALCALVFLYRHVLQKELGEFGDIVRARRPKRLPEVMTREEVKQFMRCLDGEYRLAAGLMYGAGLRLMETVRLRIKDIDFGYNRIIVRDGKGGKDRVTMLPQSVRPLLEEHLAQVNSLFSADRQNSVEGVHLPGAMGRKYPRAGISWGWQWLFPSRKLSIDRARASAAATIYTTDRFNAPLPRPHTRQVSTRKSAATPCAIRSPPILSSRAMTSAPFRSCSAIKASRPHKFTHMY